MKKVEGRGVTWNDMKKSLALTRYDVDALSERWLRTEGKFDSIQTELKKLNIKADIIIILQLFLAIMLGSLL
jgi:hypothetical protein